MAGRVRAGPVPKLHLLYTGLYTQLLAPGLFERTTNVLAQKIRGKQGGAGRT